MVDEKVIPDNLNVTPQFIAAPTQVVWTQMGMSASHPRGPVQPAFSCWW
ncbi:hypothetical protein IMZ48_07340 [Candidatus Bathyarchaeota archaeon]|nr:hypothetical protein [Candidatus Bathyarchaeota archaeon]